MRKIFSSIACAALMGFALSTGSALAGEARQDFTLINNTGYEIDQVFVSPSKNDDWEEDVLGQDTLADGDSVHITFHRDTPGCNWDLKVVYSDDGSSAVWPGQDLCNISKITIHYNRKDDVTSATTE